MGEARVRTSHRYILESRDIYAHRFLMLPRRWATLGLNLSIVTSRIGIEVVWVLQKYIKISVHKTTIVESAETYVTRIVVLVQRPNAGKTRIFDPIQLDCLTTTIYAIRNFLLFHEFSHSRQKDKTRTYIPV
jgi:hypothetical protein